MFTLHDESLSIQFLLSHYGNGFALGFKGDPEGIQRCFNWAVNTHVVGRGSRLSWFYERETGRLAYVCPPSKEAIRLGVALQMRAEIIMSREVPPLRDGWDDTREEPVLEYDERKIDRLANRRAAVFMRERITSDNFMLGRPQSIAPVYELVRTGRAERSNSSVEFDRGFI